MTLRAARILSSETDNTIKQEQNTNVNINIKPPQRHASVPIRSAEFASQMYPNVEPLSNNVNFTQANPQMGFQQGPRCGVHDVNGTTSDTAMTNPESAYPYQPPINNLSRERGIADLGSEINDLEKKNRFTHTCTHPLRFASLLAFSFGFRELIEWIELNGLN